MPFRIATCPGCGRKIATDDADDPRADWCLNCGGWGDPDRAAIANTHHLLSHLAESRACDCLVGNAA